MMRLRFSSGLILGLLLGVPAGVLVAVLLRPPHPTDQNVALQMQVQELNRKLEASKEEKQRVDQQLEQFQKLAEGMTASFNKLEQRFKGMETRLREQEEPTPTATAPPPSPTAVPQAPQAQAPGAPDTLPVPADAPPEERTIR